MAKKGSFNFKQVEAKAQKALEFAIIDVGNAARNFFIKSFRNQGFEDKTVEKWKPRKKADKRGGRGILIKTGDLRRSITNRPPNRQALTVKIVSDLDYAKIHNEGLMGKAWGKHPFNMPKRQFIGDSYKLNEEVKKIIVKRLDQVFK